MDILITSTFVLIFIGLGHLWLTKRKIDEAEIQLADDIRQQMKLKQTLAMGLYYRFNFPKEINHDGDEAFQVSTDLFLKQEPHEFEDFVANIMEQRFGGEAYLTPRTGDFGVDIEHHRDGELYLGQVKCQQRDVDYRPIAILHSNMVKSGANRGFIVTTSAFNKRARDYADSLDIDLIDGLGLIDFWLEKYEDDRNEAPAPEAKLETT
ncbi:restriction endonuclease [Tuberibacillus sp. Marseille-P3662]|uniref:restriction endonuclease n=1 Tax=Tuberibacillus sp. Marseille-P3662 TaxID=1965358 RepID=UPI0020CB0F5D|nr:restriction endonuclease [Tuberibacillus sp. Marseille-P3662]